MSRQRQRQAVTETHDLLSTVVTTWKEGRPHRIVSIRVKRRHILQKYRQKESLNEKRRVGRRKRMLAGTGNKKQKAEKCNVTQNKHIVSLLSGAQDSECNEI